MDDPWANAWGEPTKPSILDTHPATTPAWRHSLADSSSVPNDEEADIGKPSWDTGAGVQWTEPSDSHTSLWSTATTITEPWGASSYDTIPIGRASLTDADDTGHASPPTPVGSTPPSPSSGPSSPSEEAVGRLPTLPTFPQASPPPSLRSHSPEPSFIPESVPDSPDAFGTFETGLETELDEDETAAVPWSLSRGAIANGDVESVDAWGGGWAPHDDDREEQRKDDEEVIDEWEAAKQRKAKQDRYVPPELLASILRQFEELSTDLWPNVEQGSDGKAEGNDGSSSSRHRDIADSNDLKSITGRLIPADLTLPPSVQFAKTFTSKRTAESLKYTRHEPLTRLSPMAIYNASKGSTAWEASVKARVDINLDDILPPGWKVIEKAKEVPSNDSQKRTSSGILSFFGRKGGSAPSGSDNTERSASPVRPSRASGSFAAGTGSQRSSVDHAKASSSHSRAQSTERSRSSTPASPSLVTSPITSTSPVVPTPPASTSTSSFPMQNSLADNLPEASPPASAVSRFLNRFSRTKPTVSHNSRNSLALSSDDLEFLSDIVPTANDDVEDTLQLKSLSSMIQSSPLPTKLPPPLAPPPRPSLPPSRKPSDRVIGINTNIRAPALPQNADVMSLFDLSEPPAMPALGPYAASSMFDLEPSSTSEPATDAVTSFFDFKSPDISAPAPFASSSVFDLEPTAQITSSVVPSTSSAPIAPRSPADFQPFTAVPPRTSLSPPPRTATPIDKLLPPLELPIPRVRTPVALPNKRGITAIMSSSQTPVEPSVVPRLDPFSFPAPPPAPASMSRILTISPPPQVVKGVSSSSASFASSSRAVSQSPPLSNGDFFDDDDFSDFHSPPASSPSQQTTSTAFDDTSFSSFSSSQVLINGSSNTKDGNTSGAFDDFDSFVSSTIRTPSPPRPPAKPSSFAFKPPPRAPIQLASAFPPPRTTSPPKQQPPRRASRAADHSRTMSLLETAASRPGRWPAPPSPLPEALPPPGASKPSTSDMDDIFGSGGSSMQAQQAKAAAGLPPSASAPVLFPPPPQASQLNSRNNAFPPAPRFKASPTPPPLRTMSPPVSVPGQPLRPLMPQSNGSAMSTSTTPGGLSASDLSFFEGL